MNKPILCLDFDGVLHQYSSPWISADIIPDLPVRGALYFLYDAVEKFEVHIYSGRSHQKGGIKAMKTWLANELFRLSIYHGVFDKIKWPIVKPNALVHIDDRAITFTGEWPELDSLLKFKPWNKKKYGEGLHHNDLPRRFS